MINIPEEINKAVRKAINSLLFRATVTGVVDGMVQIKRPGQDDPDDQYYARADSYSPNIDDEVLCVKLMGGVIVLCRVTREP